MPAPRTVQWDLDAHTAAKHRILGAYLSAWLPIMATHNPKLLLIDGFAGPGRYTGGEEGSPLVMVRSLLDHSQRSRIEGREISFVFVESDRRRYERLAAEVETLQPRLPPRARILPIQGSFTDVAERLLAEVTNLAPTFAFIDPFGYADTRMPISGRILSFPRCEVLIYLPIPFLTRFVGRSGQDDAFNSLYGSDAWRAAIPLHGRARKRPSRSLRTGLPHRWPDWVHSSVAPRRTLHCFSV
jgi:three-Cys-motif partner protein